MNTGKQTRLQERVDYGTEEDKQTPEEFGDRLAGAQEPIPLIKAPRGHQKWAQKVALSWLLPPPDEHSIQRLTGRAISQLSAPPQGS